MDSAERDSLIAEDYAKGTLSAQKLAINYNLSVPTIRRIIAAKGLKKGTPLMGEVGFKILDETHRVLGMKLYFHRTIKKFQDTVKAGDELGWSSKKLRNIEQGYSLLTILDLQAMANYLNTSLSLMLADVTPTQNSTER